jgi:hypothetical protein
MTFADNILSFYQNLRIGTQLPKNVVVLDPYRDEVSFSYCAQFYKKFYNDSLERTMILGINPGRLGGGITGIPFTDPIKLERYCGISNPFVKKPELSADFIYSMIDGFGGAQSFYEKFYFTAISPLGFTMDGKNLNYYDLKELQDALSNFILDSLRHQLSFGITRSVCFCLGEGQNFKFLKSLNDKLNIFDKIVPLAHPRFIMQYRRKKMNDYVDDYLAKLNGKSHDAAFR